MQRIFTIPLFLALAHLAAAHDIPNDVTVRVFLKPQGNQVNLLVRVPMSAIRDVVFPERGAGHLDIARAHSLLNNAATQWISDYIEIYENGAPLPKRPRIVATRISLPSLHTFASYEHAAAHLTGSPLPEDTAVVWNQTMLDAWFEYPIQSDRSEFSINSGLAHLGGTVLTVLRFSTPDAPERAFEFTGNPGVVRLDPRWHQAVLRFVYLGFLHILDGIDHLLFLLCLVIPFRRFRSLIAVVTSFTVAHSITLIASAYDLGPTALWFPPLIEMLIAVSIVYMALENIVGGATVQRRWVVTFAFGLVHGFGFSFALRETLQFAGSHLFTSLLSFNVGVELGQLLVLIVLIPSLNYLFRAIVAERIGTIILSALVAHTGWHWMLERGATLGRFHWEWPVFTAALAASLLRWMIALVLIGAALRYVSRWSYNRDACRIQAPPQPSVTTNPESTDPSNPATRKS